MDHHRGGLQPWIVYDVQCALAGGHRGQRHPDRLRHLVGGVPRPRGDRIPHLAAARHSPLPPEAAGPPESPVRLGRSAAYVPVTFILAGMAAYTVSASEGCWTLLTVSPRLDGAVPATLLGWCQPSARDGPAHTSRLIFDRGVLDSILRSRSARSPQPCAAPLLITAIRMVRALRGVADDSQPENLLRSPRCSTPVGRARTQSRVPWQRGGQPGDLVRLSPAPVTSVSLAVASPGTWRRSSSPPSLRCATAMPRSAAGFPAASLLAGACPRRTRPGPGCPMSGSGLDLTKGAALALVCVSARPAAHAHLAAGRPGSGLPGSRRRSRSRGGDRLGGGAGARFLPAWPRAAAASESTLASASVVSVGCGSPCVRHSACLFAIFLRGRLDTPSAPERHGHAAARRPG